MFGLPRDAKRAARHPWPRKEPLDLRGQSFRGAHRRETPTFQPLEQAETHRECNSTRLLSEWNGFWLNPGAKSEPRVPVLQ